MPDEATDEAEETVDDDSDEYTFETPDFDGIEYHDTELNTADGVVGSQHFTTDEMVTVTMDAPTGQLVEIHSENFAAAKVDETIMTHDGTQGLDESAVFICSDDGEIGYGILQVQDGGTIEEAIEEFVDEYMEEGE